MAKSDKKQVRAEFRSAVFERDGYKCRCCGRPGKDRQGGDAHKRYHQSPDGQLVELDAHHICNRHLIPHGGYVAENGISVCDECHIKAEGHWNGSSADPEFSPEKLYELIG